MVEALQERFRSAQRAVSEGDCDKARVLFTFLLQDTEISRGPTDAMTLHIKMSLADLILSNDAEGLDRAQELYQQAIAGWAATHGLEHANTINARMNLAVLQKRRGRMAEAKDLMRGVVASHEAALGPDGDSTLAAKVNLANLLANTGNLDEATDILRSVHELWVTRHGPKSERALQCQVNLANVLVRAGDTSSARRLYQSALDGWGNTLSLPSLQNAVLAQLNLAVLMHDDGDKAEGRRLYTEARERCLTQLGRNHPAMTHLDRFADALAGVEGDTGADEATPRSNRTPTAANSVQTPATTTSTDTKAVPHYVNVSAAPDPTTAAPAAPSAARQQEQTPAVGGPAAPVPRSATLSPVGELADLEASLASIIAEHGEVPVKRSAIRVQSSFRGFRARKEYKQTLHATILIQSWFRGYKVRRDVRVAREAQEQGALSAGPPSTTTAVVEPAPPGLEGGEEAIDDDELSSLIEGMISEHEVETDAAVRIQTAFRGRLARREMKEVRRRSIASLSAVIDPAVFMQPSSNPEDDPGVWGRATGEAIPEWPDEKEEPLEGYLADIIEENGLSKTEDSAIRVQTSFRGFRARKEYKKRRAEFFHAVVLIQAWYRGHMARKQLRAEQEQRAEQRTGARPTPSPLSPLSPGRPATIDVNIQLNGGKLGFSIRETLVGPEMQGRGVAISKVTPGEAAERTLVLKVGMPLLAINGVPIPDLGPKKTKHAAVRMIHQAGNSLVLTCGTRFAKPTHSMQAATAAAQTSPSRSPGAAKSPAPPPPPPDYDDPPVGSLPPPPAPPQ